MQSALWGGTLVSDLRQNRLFTKPKHAWRIIDEFEHGKTITDPCTTMQSLKEDGSPFPEFSSLFLF